MIFYEVLYLVLDFIYPKKISCILCNKPIKKINTYSLCKDCFKELNFIQDGCIKCGKPIIYHSLEKLDLCGCSYCFNKSFYFDKAISCIEYSDISKSMILGFKYKNKTYMAKYISNIMKEKLDLENIKFDYITFVPLHKKKMRKRGFNQSEKIAKELGKMIDIPILDCIYRKSNTNRLYNLNRKERKIELKNAFLVKENINYANGKNILLIDDIFTTGSTVNEISKLLKLNNVNKIFVMTLLTKSNDNYIKAEN